MDHVLHDKHIEIVQGDLTEPRVGDEVDVLVISAYPDNYLPTAGSVIGALAAKGLLVSELAKRKERDYRRDFSCWLSESIAAPHPWLRAERVLCFESALNSSDPTKVVDDIFRSLAPFIGSYPHVVSIAMSLVNCGDQGTPIEAMVEPLVRAAVDWMRTSRLNHVRIVERSPAVAARLKNAFEFTKQRVMLEQTDEMKNHDVFLSYSRENTRAADLVEENLRAIHSGIRIFRDTVSLRAGKDFRIQLDCAVRKARRFVPLYSPDYLKSPACQDEFNAAWNIRERAQPNLFFPLFMHKVRLIDPRMEKLHYEDCVDADTTKIRRACEKLVKQLV